MPWAPVQKAPFAALLQGLATLHLRLVELRAKQQLQRAAQQVRMFEAQVKKGQANELDKRRSR